MASFSIPGGRPVGLFQLGRLLATPGALRACEAAGADLTLYLARHVSGDWGELIGEEDSRANVEALQHGSRVFSGYRLPDGTRIWIITEADRHATTVLLPEEY